MVVCKYPSKTTSPIKTPKTDPLRCTHVLFDMTTPGLAPSGQWSLQYPYIRAVSTETEKPRSL